MIDHFLALRCFSAGSVWMTAVSILAPRVALLSGALAISTVVGSDGPWRVSSTRCSLQAAIFINGRSSGPASSRLVPPYIWFPPSIRPRVSTHLMIAWRIRSISLLQRLLIHSFGVRKQDLSDLGPLPASDPIINPL